MTYGLPESSLSDLIEDWELSLASHLKLAYLPELSSGVKLRLSGYESQSLLKYEIDTAFQQLQTILGKLIYGEFRKTPKRFSRKGVKSFGCYSIRVYTT